MNMNKLLKILAVTFAAFSNPVSAVSALYTITDTNTSEAEKILINAFAITYFIGVIMGVYLTYYAFTKFIEYANNPNHAKVKISSILIVAIGGSILFSLGSSLQILVNTGTGSSGYCFNYQDKLKTTATSSVFKNESATCFDASTSEITSELKAKLEQNGKTEALEKFNTRFTLLLTAFQVIGLIFFVKSLTMLVDIAEGKSQLGYPSVLIIAFMSLLAIDINGTLEIIINTAKELSAI